MREFSDEARDKLYAIIDDINDKQWCGFTDWMAIDGVHSKNG